MSYSIKKLLNNAKTAVELGYRIVRGIDYQTLSQYILNINKHKEVDAILHEVSHCLKDILNYELFGFVLKKGSSTDLWIDPRVYSEEFSNFVHRDFGGQKTDYIMRYFEKKTSEERHNIDVIDVNSIISYKIIEGNYSARLYISPKRKMLYHHDAIIGTIIKSISIAMEKNINIQQLENAAAIDPLTSCYNRRALSTFLENAAAYARRYKNDLSVIMFDMDNFKEINDVHGHLAGDVVLKEIAALIPTLVRKSDYFVRYGGEEFLLVLPDTSLYHAVQLADKLRQAVSEHPIKIGDTNLIVSASFGVGSLENKRDCESLLQEADERLYKAKAMGKNTVVPSLLPCFGDKKFVAGSFARKCSLAQLA